MRIVKFTTRVARANTTTKTLKTSIPKQIAQLLGLKAKDYIEWLVKFEKGNIEICISKKSSREDT